jgi:cellulose synthase/poly-beta-1,6-N-acetylglucosamine synthase-like glycosyltransferase
MVSVLKVPVTVKITLKLSCVNVLHILLYAKCLDLFMLIFFINFNVLSFFINLIKIFNNLNHSTATYL